MKRRFEVLLLVFLGFSLVIVVFLFGSPNLVGSSRPSELCPSIQKGLEFLSARYDPAVGLLNEAQQTTPNTFWLTNDNALAAFTFDQLGQPISVPPLADRTEIVSSDGTIEILQEVHDGPAMEDWAESHYRGSVHAEGDANTETTALSLLAEYHYGCPAD